MLKTYVENIRKISPLCYISFKRNICTKDGNASVDAHRFFFVL